MEGGLFLQDASPCAMDEEAERGCCSGSQEDFLFMGIGRKGVIVSGLGGKKGGVYYVFPDFGVWRKIFSKFHDKIKHF